MDLSRWVTKVSREKQTLQCDRQAIDNDKQFLDLISPSRSSLPPIQSIRNAITVFVDGSCFHNCKKKNQGRAGIGVVFPEYTEFNMSEKLPGENATNNRAELYAIIRSLEIVNHKIDPCRRRELIVKTDSELSMNICNKWMRQWKIRGWKKADNQVAANLDLLIILDELLQTRKVTVTHVRAHTMRTDVDSRMNAQADALAKRGAMS